MTGASGRLGNDDVVAASSERRNVAVVAHATPHTKGAWVEYVATTTFDVGAIGVQLLSETFAASTDTSSLLDIGVGAAASETVVVPDIPVGWKFGTSGGVPPAFIGIYPVFIPKGSRIAMRRQSAVASASVNVHLQLFPLRDDRQPPSKLLAIGANAATSQGAGLTNPGSTNTKGAWAEIVASCPMPLQGVVIGVQGKGDVSQGGGHLLDIGVGAAGGEVVVIADMYLLANTSEWIHVQWPGPYQIDIPLGARISARFQSTSTTSGVDVILIGIPA